MPPVFLDHKIQLPKNSLTEFIERFWMVSNMTNEDHQIVVIPDGRIDLVFTIAGDKSVTSTVVGLETEPSLHTVTKGTIIMGVGLKLLAVEYCLKYSITSILGSTTPLTSPVLNIAKNDLNDFDIGEFV